MRNKKMVLVTLVVISTMLILAACGPATTTPAPATTGGGTTGGSTTGGGPTAVPPDGGELAAGFTLDPAAGDDEGSQKVAALLYEGLVRMDGGTVAPGLARAWVISEDKLTYTFELWSNATFSDGTPVTADVVVANFNRWFDPASADRGSGAYAAFAAAFGGFKGETDANGLPKSELDGVDKSDNLTVIVHLNRPDPDLLTKLASTQFSIVKVNGADFVGSGPYVVGGGTDTSLTLAPNATYWQGAPTGNVEFTIK